MVYYRNDKTGAVIATSVAFQSKVLTPITKEEFDLAAGFTNPTFDMNVDSKEEVMETISKQSFNDSVVYIKNCTLTDDEITIATNNGWTVITD
jgi:hypothetical protein